MTQKRASQETVPGPAGDRNVPLPGAPAQELIFQLSINSQLLLWSLLAPAHLQAKQSLLLLVQTLSLRKEPRAASTGRAQCFPDAFTEGAGAPLGILK